MATFYLISERKSYCILRRKVRKWMDLKNLARHRNSNWIGDPESHTSLYITLLALLCHV